jgi:hypothetical protein
MTRLTALRFSLVATIIPPVTSTVFSYEQSNVPIARRAPLRWAPALLFVLPMLAAMLVFLGSPHGLGLTNDSARYLRIAKVVSGEQRLGKIYPEYMRHFPPGYPAMLAAGKWIGIDKLAIGRWWNAIAFALTTLIIGFTVYRLCDRTLWPAFVASLLVIISHVSLEMHLHIWSEPAFQVFLLLTISLLARQVDAPTRQRAILIALVVATSTMVRYAGASLIIMGTLTLFFVQRSSWRDRFIDCVIFSAIAVAPLLCLAAYNQDRTEGGEALDRSIKFYGVHRVQIREAWVTFATWIFPNIRIRQATELGIPGRRDRVCRRRRKSCVHPSSRAAATGRIPAPAVANVRAIGADDVRRVPGVPVPLGGLRRSLHAIGRPDPLADLSSGHRDRHVRRASRAHADRCDARAVHRQDRHRRDAHRVLHLHGRARLRHVRVQPARRIRLHERAMAEFALMEVIRAIPPNTLVYTNVPDAVYFFTTNQSRLVPKSDQKLTPAKLKQMREQLKETQRRIRSEGAVIALFYGTADTRFRRGSQSSAEIEKILNARRAINCKDGVIMIPNAPVQRLRRSSRGRGARCWRSSDATDNARRNAADNLNHHAGNVGSDDEESVKETKSALMGVAGVPGKNSGQHQLRTNILRACFDRDRDRHPEGRAIARCAAQSDRTAEQRRELLRESPGPGRAAVFAGVASIELSEFLEDQTVFLRVDARAAIGDRRRTSCRSIARRSGRCARLAA